METKDKIFLELKDKKDYANIHKAEGNESYKSLIEKYTNNAILPAFISCTSLLHEHDSKGNPIYYVDVNISADSLKNILGISEELIIKKLEAKTLNICTYKPLFKKETTYEKATLSVKYEQHHVSEFASEDRITHEGKTYLRLFVSDKVCFVEEQIVNQGTTNQISDLMENCITVNYGKNKITDTKVCPEDSLQCDVQKLKEALKSKVANDAPGLETCIAADSNYIYAEGRYPDFIKGFLKRVMSSHPMEWDKTLYDKLAKVNNGIEYEDFSESSIPDIWTDQKNNLGKKNCFYFANPVYFFDRMDELGLLQFNPYKSVKYRNIYSYTEIPAGINGEDIVKNNPGFAPYAGEGKGINDYYKITGFFNEWYTSYYHEGVDFCGENSKTPLHSLINGRVVAMGDQEKLSYGKFLIVEGAEAGNEKKFFYLLGHLNRYVEGLQLGHYVYPKMTVGYLGNTGNCWTGSHPVTDEERSQGKGAHLHLSVLLASNISDIYDSINKRPKDVGKHSINPFLITETRK